MIINTETVKDMSDGKLCELLGPAWIISSSDRDAVYREIESRGVICLNGQVAGYGSQPNTRASVEPEPEVPHQSTGTCFAVSPNEVITSHHVVAGADQITVQFQPGDELSAVVTEQSQSTDLAVLTIQSDSPFSQRSHIKPLSVSV